MPRRALVQLAQLAAGLVLAVTRAEAGPGDGPPFVLTYEAPAGCPGDAAFRADVASHVHALSSAAGVRVNLAIEAHDTGYLGILVAFDESGTKSSRRIEGKTCSDVAHALAFLAGLVIELGGRVEPEAPPAPTSSPPPPVTIAAAPVVAVAPPRPYDVSAVLLAGARGGFGPVVRIAAEAGVDISAHGGILAPSVRVAGFAGEGHLDGTGGSAALWFVGGRFELCPLRFGNAYVVLRSCAGGELGAVHAQGQVVAVPRAVTELWASVEATLRVQWLATNVWSVELGGGPELPLVRARYYFEPDRILYVVPPLTARGAVGLRLQF
jgi:hypothetical protein